MRHTARTALLLLLLGASPASAQDRYLNFETVPTRPLALSPDGSRLFVTNTPDNRVEVFSATGSGLVHLASVPVGLEPVAVNARTDTEIWVVNHLSDSVSIIDAGLSPPRVVRTLLVGDEPADVVFGGTPALPGGPFPRAFVSAARRGQNHPETPKAELLTPGIGRADVWVFDATTLGDSLVGNHEAIVRVFGDKPRPLAVSADGATVYVGIFHSGNRTTSIFEGAVCNGGEVGTCFCDGGGGDSCEGSSGLTMPGGVPGPREDSDSPANPGPETGILVGFNPSSGRWEDAIGRDWSVAVPFALPDKDVFAIDATADPPVEAAFASSVGTILFFMAVHPGSGKLFVAHSDANNRQRFEGPDVAGAGSLRGHLHEASISILELPGGNDARHLNKHINYGPGAVSFNGAGSRADSLATPVGLQFSADGSELWVAAFGSAKIGVFDVAQLEADTFFPDSSDHIALSGGGPAGLARDDANNRMYVYTRLDNAVKTVDVSTRLEEASTALHDVEPAAVTDGRRFLYDADFTSSNGEASCSACHVFGNMDDLAWNLGNPSGVQVPNPNPFTVEPVFGEPNVFHPLKGPMTSQTLRGMADMGPMHWRGDRTGGNALPPVDPLDEIAAFNAFIVAFDGLLGRDEGEIPAVDMAAFADFALTITPPPNPHRKLDNELCTEAEALSPSVPQCTESELQGQDDFINVPADVGVLECEQCHTLDPASAHFGGDGNMTEEGEPQFFKVPHLRNVYDKHGMFGTTSGDLAPGVFGDQIRGFGVLHDGSVANVFDFVSAPVFELTPTQRDRIVSYLFVFDTNLASNVGQQVTLTASSGLDATTRIALLEAAARDPFALKGVPSAKECELVVKGVIAGESRGFLYDPDELAYRDDRGDPWSAPALQALAATPGQELTYLCVYPQGGRRIGIDRNGDGILDGEQCGDVSGDGLVTGTDARLMRQELAGTGPSPFLLARCNVTGAPGGGSAECNVADAASAIRHAQELGPALGQLCGAAL